MLYRQLGAAGVKLSEIGLGGWLTFGHALDPVATRRVLHRAFDLGINFFDTANAYARGACEALWGEILSERPRSSYVLATKVFFPMGDGPNDRGLSRKHIVEQCHASLRRLRTDYLDLYQCHRHDPATPLEETLATLDDLVRQGKVLYWGFSEWPVEAIEKALRLCAENGWERPRSSQPQYNAAHRWVEKSVLPLCDKAGIGQVVFSPLAQGVLTGKYRPGQPLPADSRAADDRQNQFIKGLIADEALLARVQRLPPIAAELGCSMAQMALAWLLHRREVTSCIVGASRPEQLDDNAQASGLRLSDEVVDRINQALSAG